jgi:hypothetical protein
MENLGLVKKSACLVPKLLSKVQKEERMQISQDWCFQNTSLKRLQPSTGQEIGTVNDIHYI